MAKKKIPINQPQAGLNAAFTGLKLDGLPAILDVPVGKGHVVLFAFNPMHRFLNHSDFRFVYNAILNWNDLPARHSEAVASR